MAKSEYGREYSKEIIALKKDFENFTGIKIRWVKEQPAYWSWKRLVLGSLNGEEMRKVADYIWERFYTKGMYTHLLPKIHSYEDRLVLTVDVEMIREFIMRIKKRAKPE